MKILKRLVLVLLSICPIVLTSYWLFNVGRPKHALMFGVAGIMLWALMIALYQFNGYVRELDKRPKPRLFYTEYNKD